MGVRGVRPCVAKRAEAGFAFGDRGEGVQQISGRARQTVKPGHHQHITGLELVERFAELAAVGLGAARGFAEHLLASGLGELTHLRAHALTVG